MAIHLKAWRGAVQAALFAAVPLAISAAPPEQKQAASPQQVLQTAALALKAGDSRRAYTFSAALLKRDPRDRTALLINSRAARSLGDFQEARRAAKKAWKLAESGEQKYAASMVMAQALSSGGHKTLAQFWLRRAVEHAPTLRHESRAVRDFQYLRATTPWHHQLSFSVTPDSNVNNGSRESTIYLPMAGVHLGLTGLAQALSGIEYATRINSRYRFKVSETRAHDLVLAAEYRTYTLSSDAKAQAPGVKGSDFAFGSLLAGYAHKGLNLSRQGEYRFGAQAGQTWYGGATYTRLLRLNAGQSFKLTPQRTIGARIMGERQFGVRTNDLDTLRGDFSYNFRLGSGLSVWSNLSVAQTSSDNRQNEFSEVSLQTQITLPKPVLGASARFGLSARTRDYDVSLYSVNGRQDDRLTADFSLTFKQIDYYGFNPTLRISGSTTDSNVNLYKSNRYGVNFGIQSAF